MIAVVNSLRPVFFIISVLVLTWIQFTFEHVPINKAADPDRQKQKCAAAAQVLSRSVPNGSSASESVPCMHQY